jgi:hypothetical protein
LTIHIRSLPLDLRARVVTHEVFRSALFVARFGGTPKWLEVYAGALEEQTRSREDAAHVCLHLRRGRPDSGLVTFWGRARRDALTALASACGRTLILRRVESLGGTPGSRPTRSTHSPPPPTERPSRLAGDGGHSFLRSASCIGGCAIHVHVRQVAGAYTPARNRWWGLPTTQGKAT